MGKQRAEEKEARRATAAEAQRKVSGGSSLIDLLGSLSCGGTPMAVLVVYCTSAHNVAS